ncbi:RKM5 [Sanghuangporus vaninii]
MPDLEENRFRAGVTHYSNKLIQDPTGLIRLPSSSVRVEDPEEEVFLLYTALSSRKPHDISSISFPGLGSVNSKQDTITVRFTLPSRSKPDKSGETTPRTKKLDKNAKLGTSPKVDRKRAKSSATVSDGEERTLEIELVQDKTALRSKRGDTGSVLWRVSVALGQALLNDFSSDSPCSLFDPEKLKNCNVLELGAGTGLLSLVFAPWVHHYTATDLDYLVPLIRKNVTTNLPVVQQARFRNTADSKKYPTSSSKISKRTTGSRGSEDSSNAININIRRNESFIDPIQVTVEPLDWLELHRHRQHASPRHGSGGANSTSLTGRSNTAFRLAHADPPELIVIADCVYNPALIPGLLSAVEHYAAPGRTCVLVAAELRSADVVREFLESWVGLGGWEIWRVGRAAVGPRESDVDVESDEDGGDADACDVHVNDGWLSVDFVVWVGWKP